MTSERAAYTRRYAAPGTPGTTHRVRRFCKCPVIDCKGECCQPDICSCHPEFLERMTRKANRR